MPAPSATPFSAPEDAVTPEAPDADGFGPVEAPESDVVAIVVVAAGKPPDAGYDGAWPPAPGAAPQPCWACCPCCP